MKKIMFIFIILLSFVLFACDKTNKEPVSYPENVDNNNFTWISSNENITVSSDGTVSATLKDNAVYYGFDSSCTGNNELSKKITISASKKGESGAKLVNYYIKTKAGNIGSCHITVIKECNCTDPKSTAANCPVTCTFRAN